MYRPPCFTPYFTAFLASFRERARFGWANGYAAPTASRCSACFALCARRITQSVSLAMIVLSPLLFGALNVICSVSDLANCDRLLFQVYVGPT
jgi:hypothetical protein